MEEEEKTHDGEKQYIKNSCGRNEQEDPRY